jgi:DMSO/TMAO reductase YedYZ heme-binding membrane subunit
VNEQFWWYVARGSGLTAWALASASVLWGLALSGRTFGRSAKPAWLTDLHRFLGGLTIVFTLVHLFGLVADSYLELTFVDLVVPFASDWEPLATAGGVVAFWLLLAVELTSLGMRRMPRRAWRWVHLSSYGLWALATGHLLAAGTDAGTWPVLGAVVIITTAVGFLTTYRVIGPRRDRGRRSGIQRAATRRRQPVTAR